MKENPARTRLGAAYALLCLGIGVAGIAMPKSRSMPRPDWSLEGWRPSAQKLHPAFLRDRKLAEAKPFDPKAAAAAVSALHTLGKIEARARGKTNDPDYLRATREAAKAMNAYWFRHGKEGYQALGVHMADRFVATVVGALVKANEADMPVLEWLETDTPQVHEVTRIAGDFIAHAVEWGLIRPGNRLAGDQPYLLRIHFEVRWYQFVTEIMDYTMLMDPEELKALWRWRLEGDTTLAMAQRRKVGTWLRRLEPSYPIYRTLGTLYGRSGEYRKAIPLLREALLDAPCDRTLRRNLGFALFAVNEARVVRPRR